MSPHQLRINVLATRDELVRLETFDLCKASSRNSFIKATATELYLDEPVIKKDMGRLLLTLEQIQQDLIDAATHHKEVVVELTAEEQRDALQFLRAPDLINRILHDYDACGLVR